MNVDVLIQDDFLYYSHGVTLHFERDGDDLTVKVSEDLGEEPNEEPGGEPDGEPNGEPNEEPNEEKYFIFEIHSVSSTIETEVDVLVKNQDNIEIGFICFGDELVNKPLNEYTKIKLIGLNLEYISSVNNTRLNESESYVLNKSYALIKSEFASEYKSSLLNSSGIWGGFSHSNANSLYKKNVSEIIARSGIKLPTAEHEMKLLDAITSKNGFDRFLKKYHMLELLYDYICVLKLKTMESSIKNFRHVMKEYSKDEVKSLKALLEDYVSNVNEIVSVMETADIFGQVVTDVFHVYSKESDPLTKGGKWAPFKELLVEHDLSLVKCKSKKLCNDENYRLFILGVVTYWIYRIRCSIAHNKIGEFIFELEDEKFVVEIGEKLLDIVISQVLSNPELKDMFDKENQINAILNSGSEG